MLKIGFIDYYLDEWHANSYPKMIQNAAGDQLVVAYAYGQIPSPITGMTAAQWCEKYGVALCETIEELVEKSDVLLVLSPLPLPDVHVHVPGPQGLPYTASVLPE